MDVLIYALIKLRQSDTEHSPLARQAIKRLEKQEKQLKETRTLCRMIQGAEDLEEVRLLSRSMQKILGHQN